MGFKKGSIGAILMEDLNNLKKDNRGRSSEDGWPLVKCA